MSDDAIRFIAQVYKVQTLVDGGIRITLDLPETAIEAATQLMKAKQGCALVEVAAVAVVKQQDNNAIQTRSEWKP